MTNFYKKYLKYKTKYNTLKYGGNPGAESRIQEIPQLCFGTGQPGFYTSLPQAFDAGFRHIDGADGYEFTLRDYTKIMRKTYFDMMREMIKLVPRNELWITWKTDNLSKENVQSIIEKLDCQYIDLLLYHHGCSIPSQQLVTVGLIRYFGVSNCEDLALLNGRNIYATQNQARPPRGNLNKGHINFNDFVNNCNSFDVKVMLYGSTSSLYQNGFSSSGYFTVENLKLVNKYYLQKYIKDKKNILIVSSQTGDSIIPNIVDFNKIMRGEDLISPDQIQEIELELEKYKLVHM